ncbi:MAG: hypothetical protein JSS50_01070 [Proteobacteria bacterium]|nr:hypothetical protein [Pseudomonadota bacterium]
MGKWGHVAYAIKKFFEYMIIGLLASGMMGVLLQRPFDLGFRIGITFGLLPVLLCSLTTVVLQLKAIKHLQNVPSTGALQNMPFKAVYNKKLFIYSLALACWVLLVYSLMALLLGPEQGFRQNETLFGSTTFAFTVLLLGGLPLFIACSLWALIDTFELKSLVQKGRIPGSELTFVTVILLILMAAIVWALCCYKNGAIF